ncbi:hypothetical protein FGO68_gene9811 [Halteria grandinella]|uniref:MORN repeat-containing protein n=1 Tax=Halteria grandinella TaxID=5974 RepID=A0A8J8NJZ4_HALGN|nr:hypothetical protein FGO68_gene9811 [Halteria grandinella]
MKEIYTGELNEQYERHGYGHLQNYYEKYSYTGQFINYYPRGQGFHTRNSGVYEGTFEPNGIIRGKCSYPNGDQYEGEFEYFVPHGRGVKQHSKDGSTWEGEWKRGQKNGQGTISLADGSKQKGKWRNDIPIGIHKYFNKSNCLMGTTDFGNIKTKVPSKKSVKKK